MNYRAIVEQLTLREKCQLMSGKNVWQTVDIPRLGIESVVLSDGPHGIRKQVGSGDHLGLNESIPATCFPTAATIANSWDVDLAEQVGKALGEEAQALDVQVVLGPGMNIKRNPLCGRNFEYFSEDPALTGELATAYVKGIQSQGVAACPKHFAVNSQELHRMSVNSIIDERTLREIYLRAFETVVKKSKPLFMMTSYNPVNGVYTNEHPYLLRDILCSEWNYQGAVVSDWGGSNQHAQGVKVGSHLEMPTTGMVGVKELEAAIHAGYLSESELNQRVEELLAVIMPLSAQKQSTNSPTCLPFDLVESHHKLAQKAAESSIVLLKNEDEVLPLNQKETIALIGDFASNPRFQGAGSSLVNPTRLETLCSVVAQATEQTVQYAQGYERSGRRNATLIQEAIHYAKQVDKVIVVVGLTEIAESEGMDRVDLRLPDNQLELIREIVAVNPNVIVVLMGGAVVELPFDTAVKAIVHSYLAGQAGASAIWNVLTGVVNPSGKLAETYPERYEDVASASYYPGKEYSAEYREGLYVGYRYYDKVGQAVKYPFGFGLSYTKFRYDNLCVSPEKVEVSISNIGAVAGEEVIQVYADKIDSSLYRPVQELVAFKKICLEPGETRKVTLEYMPHSFEFYDVASSKWQCEEGEYKIVVGGHSRDVQASAELYLKGVSVAPNVVLLPHYETGHVQTVPDEEFELLLGNKLPVAQWNRSKLLVDNDTFVQLAYAKSWLARLVYRIVTLLLKRSIKRGKPDLNLFFAYNITFRGIAKLSNGRVDQAMIQALLTMINGRFIRGLRELYRANKQKGK